MPVSHYHESWDELAYGLSGVVTFRIDGKEVEVGPGGRAFIRRGVVRGLENRSDAPAHCLCVLTPGVLGPCCSREIAALAAKGAPNPAALGGIMRRHGLVQVPPR